VQAGIQILIIQNQGLDYRFRGNDTLLLYHFSGITSI